MDSTHYVYILTNPHHTTLYVGMTSNLGERMDQHVRGVGSTFTAKYNTTKLVWHEEFDSYDAAHEFEAKLKKWKRKWKENLITKTNPAWSELPPPIL